MLKMLKMLKFVGFCCKQVMRREYPSQQASPYTATPKIALMKESAPRLSPVSISLIWPV